MALFHNKYRIESARRRDWDDSSPERYFVTVVTWHRAELFGRIEKQKMILNENGAIVERCWDDLRMHYANFHSEAFVIMPNHFHAIIRLIDNAVAIETATEIL